MEKTTLFGISLYNGTYQSFQDIIMKPASKTLVFTPNPEIFVRANRDQEFMEILEKATYNVPDGNGLYVGYMMQEGMSFPRAAYTTFFHKKSVGKNYGELIKGSDLTRDILRSSNGQKVKILVIDKQILEPRNDLEKKKKDIQKNLKNILETKYSGIEIFAVFAGQKSSEEIATLIQEEHVQYVLSCIGMKAQEKLLVEIFAHLPEDEKVVGLGVGASIDFLLGIQKRAPIIFQKLGLEWLYRLITQPRIRARRIYDAVVEFPRLIKK